MSNQKQPHWSDLLLKLAFLILILTIIGILLVCVVFPMFDVFILEPLRSLDQNALYLFV
jgi:hypothetical protein